MVNATKMQKKVLGNVIHCAIILNISDTVFWNTTKNVLIYEFLQISISDWLPLQQKYPEYIIYKGGKF